MFKFAKKNNLQFFSFKVFWEDSRHPFDYQNKGARYSIAFQPISIKHVINRCTVSIIAFTMKNRIFPDILLNSTLTYNTKYIFTLFTRELQIFKSINPAVKVTISIAEKDATRITQTLYQ